MDPANRSTIRVLQANVQQTDPYAQQSAVVLRLLEKADIVKWNELGNLQVQALVRKQSGWAHYFPGPSANSVAISWRSDRFEMVDCGSVKMHGGVLKITPTRWVNWVLLRDLSTGKLFYVMNTHVVHHIEQGGKQRWTTVIVGQIARAKTHLTKMYGLIAELGAKHPLIGGGDLNIDWKAEKALPPSERVPWFPYTGLAKVAKIVVPDHGTHGNRVIDWGWIVGDVTVLSVTALPRGTSDHNPVLTVIEL